MSYLELLKLAAPESIVVITALALLIADLVALRETLATIVNGELTQMFSARGVIERENYYQRIYAKTASLFEMSALAATMVATRPRSEVIAGRRNGCTLLASRMT